jgi:hypothetical protein
MVSGLFLGVYYHQKSFEIVVMLVLLRLICICTANYTPAYLASEILFFHITAKARFGCRAPHFPCFRRTIVLLCSGS